MSHDARFPLSERRQRIITLRDKGGLAAMAANEVALGEQFLRQLSRARTLKEVKILLAWVIIREFGLGRSHDGHFKVLEELIQLEE